MGWAVATGAVRLQSDGNAWRPLIHVQDMARAICAALRAPRERVHCVPFNTGATEANYLVRDLALLVGEVVPGATIEFADGAGADPRSYRVDFSKIAEELEFRPEWDARGGAQQLADTYRSAGMDEAMFSSDRFVRLARLKTLMSAGRLDDQLRWAALAERVPA